MKDKQRDMNMRNINTGNKFGENFESQRQEREVEKYGSRLPIPQMAAHAHIYLRHSIEPAYGNYDRPINESV